MPKVPKIEEFYLFYSAIRSSKSEIQNLEDSFQQGIHLAHDLLILVPAELNGFGRAFGRTDATSMAGCRINFTDTLLINFGHIIRT